jgi:AraC-like DNA-binding protein
METISETRQQLYFRVHRNLEIIRPADWEVARIDRPYTVCWYILSGDKSIEVDNVPYHVRQGDLVVFPSQKPFKVNKSNKPIELHHLDIAIENKYGPYNLFSLYKFPVVLSSQEQSDSFKRFIDLWKKLNAEWSISNPAHSSDDENQNFDLNRTIHILQNNALTIEWYAELLAILRPFSGDVSPSFDPRLQRLFIFIKNNLSEKLSLEILAKEVYLSESHLSLLFRTHLRTSPMDYVREARLQKARELLLTTNLQIKEISEMVGFEGQSQLSRAFKKNVGVSPNEYRNKSDYI